MTLSASAFTAAGSRQPPRDVAAHPAEADHAKLHRSLLALCSSLAYRLGKID
jgi:hypothetical protein